MASRCKSKQGNKREEAISNKKHSTTTMNTEARKNREAEKERKWEPHWRDLLAPEPPSLRSPPLHREGRRPLPSPVPAMVGPSPPQTRRQYTVQPPLAATPPSPPPWPARTPPSFPYPWLQVPFPVSSPCGAGPPFSFLWFQLLGLLPPFFSLVSIIKIAKPLFLAATSHSRFLHLHVWV